MVHWIVTFGTVRRNWADVVLSATVCQMSISAIILHHTDTGYGHVVQNHQRTSS